MPASRIAVTEKMYVLILPVRQAWMNKKLPQLMMTTPITLRPTNLPRWR
jgi:hypothetical protein